MNDLRQLNIDYAKRMIVDSIWREAHLEGINVTFPDTQEIFDGRLVANLNVNDVVTINNLKHAWQFILDTLDVDVNKQYISQLNHIIGSNLIQQAGEIRTTGVRITGTEWKPLIPSDESIAEMFNKINDINNPTDKALAAFSLIAKNQVFIDGNKRTAQLVANKLLIDSCSGIFSVPVEQKNDFGKHLVKFYETDDLDTFTHYLKDVCLDDIFLPKHTQEFQQPSRLADRATNATKVSVAKDKQHTPNVEHTINKIK